MFAYHLVLAKDTFWEEHTEYFCCASIIGREENLMKIGHCARIRPDAEE